MRCILYLFEEKFTSREVHTISPSLITLHLIHGFGVLHVPWPMFHGEQHWTCDAIPPSGTGGAGYIIAIVNLERCLIGEVESGCMCVYA
jgi:hypothetical protein